MEKFRNSSDSKLRLVLSIASFDLSGIFLCVSEHIIFYGTGLSALLPTFAMLKVRIFYRGLFPSPKDPVLGR
jgi:hypothetical protein